MNCHVSRWTLSLLRRDAVQVDAVEASAAKRHLDQCPACHEWAQVEFASDAALSAAMRDVPVPASLRDAVLRRLADAPRPPRRWRAPVALAAALTALVVGFVFWPRTRVIDLEQHLQNVEYRERASPEDVEAYFDSLGHRISAPRAFNYDLLTGYELAEFQGRQVPRLTFSRGAVQAYVYVLSADRFRLPDELQLDRGRRHAEVLTSPGFHYVVDSVGGPASHLMNLAI